MHNTGDIRLKKGGGRTDDRLLIKASYPGDLTAQ